MPIDLFHIIDDAIAIIRQNGIFKQVKMYRRANEVFVMTGGGYVRLDARGGTTVPSISWIDLDAKGVTPCKEGSHKAGAPMWSAQYRCDKAIDIEEAIKDAPPEPSKSPEPPKSKKHGKK